MIRRPTPLLAGLFALSLSTLAGCQSAKPNVDQSGQPSIIAESAKNLEGMPYHVKSTTTITGDPGGAPDLNIVTEGDVATPRRARLTLSSPQQPGTVFELVLWDEDLYARPGSGDWQQLPAAQIAQLGPSPVDASAYLRGATGPAEDKGSEDVNGVKARRFGLTLNVPALVDQLDKLGRPIQQEIIKDAKMEVWISEGDALARRSKVSLNLTQAGGQTGGTLEMDTTAVDFGKPVQIELPKVAPAVPSSDPGR